MCCLIDRKKTEQYKKRKKREIWVYKKLNQDVKTTVHPSGKTYFWRAPYMYTKYPFKGIVKSRRQSKKLSKMEIAVGKIHHGIHVWLNKDFAQVSYLGHFIFRVKVNLDDLIAVGQHGDAVFTKIFFDEKERCS